MRGIRSISAVVLALLFVGASVLPAAPLWDESAKKYDSQDFQGARQDYEQLLAQGAISANVFFNLGNTEFRLKHLGPAALSYERALLLEPTHPESRANLALLRGQAGAKTLPANQLQPLLLPLSSASYCAVGAAALWLVILSLAILILWRRAAGLLLTLGGFGLLIAAYAGFALWQEVERRALAVVIVPEAVARLEAADRAGAAEALPAGSDVRVLSEHGAWTYCELPGGGRGWLPRKSIEKVSVGDI